MKYKILLITLLFSFKAFSAGGDDSGNGGFAYKQSILILEMATKDLEHKIISSRLKELNDYPERRRILQETLAYDRLLQLPKKNAYRNGKKLAMDYIVNPPTVKILKSYYEAFMGKTDAELDEASLEVQKRLLHEASHIWGYNEKDSEAFALRFLANINDGEKRPTRQVYINSDFCSCLNGKSDIINDCSNFCASKPITSTPTLYLNTTMGPDILNDPKLGNLYNWCNASLPGDVTSPQCTLTAWDGVNIIEGLAVKSIKGNALTADLSQLAINTTYIVKIVESKSGSNAESLEFQIRRVPYRSPDSIGALTIAPINQYTCLLYGGIADSSGNIERTSYTREYYYFANNEVPEPMPPLPAGTPAMTVCHDEVLYPGNDSVLYPRLELIPQKNSMWDKSDLRFRHTGRDLRIHEILEERLDNEYNMHVKINLFSSINLPNRPTERGHDTLSYPLGFIMVPFIDPITGKTMCPSRTDFLTSTEPLFRILKDYMDGTEALYVAEQEPDLIDNNVFYPAQFATQGELLKYGFYVENGMQIRANENDLHRKVIYFYWPMNSSVDPLQQGSRKLFTVKYPHTFQGNILRGLPQTLTTDKRIGCVPKTPL